MISSKKELTGTIIKGIGGFYYVSTNEGIIECRARGKFRQKELTPMVGDRVTLLYMPDGSGSVSSIHPRKNFLIRPEISNVDALVVVSAIRSPSPDFMLIDKLLVTAKSKGIDGFVCINKTDLADSTKTEEFCRVYTRAGYKVLKICAKSGEGIDEIKSIIQGKTVAFAGLSGVGKSSLLTRLTGIDLKTGTVSKIERGKHTTRHTELMEACGGYVFDTPGFSRLETDELFASELEGYFPEFSKVKDACRFRSCNHTGEPDCAVRDAVEKGIIAQSRYENYVALYNRLKSIKDWERKD